MILIAHRGNFNSKQPDKENTFSYIMDAIDEGYDVEIDLWYQDDQFYLGHDFPQHPISESELASIKVYSWCHAKNMTALHELLVRKYNVFFHDQDLCTLTSTGVIWSHKHQFNPHGIVVMPSLEKDIDIIVSAAGVCHDRLDKIEQILANSNTNK